MFSNSFTRGKLMNKKKRKRTAVIPHVFSVYKTNIWIAAYSFYVRSYSADVSRMSFKQPHLALNNTCNSRSILFFVTKT